MSNTHVLGPGLKIVGDPTRPWYGGGYCGICGHRGEGLIPIRVRWWDPDDGWKTGVLCEGCGEDASERGPEPEDFACVTKDFSLQAEKLDTIDFCSGDDEDAAQTESEDMEE